MQELPPSNTNELSTPPKGGVNLSVYVRIVKRYALLIAGITGGVLGAMLYLLPQDPPRYTGSFQVLVEPVTSAAKAADPTAIARTEKGAPNDSLFNLDYPTQIAILTGPSILEAIAQQLQNITPEDVQGILKSQNLQPQELEAITQQVQQLGPGEIGSGLSVVRIGAEGETFDREKATKILQISYEGLNTKVVTIVLEKTAEKYLKYSLEEQKTRIRQGVRFIEEQLPELQKRVDLLQKKQQQLQEQYELISPDTKGEELFTQVRELTSQQLEIQGEYLELQTLYANLQKQLALTPQEAIAASALSEDPNRTQLLGEIKDIEAKIAIESTRFTPNSPNIIALERKRANLLALLNRETQRILGENFTGTAENSQVLSYQNSLRLDLISQLIDTANKIQILQVRNQSIDSAKTYLEKEAKQIPQIARQYNEVERQLQLTKGILNQLLTQRETLRVEAAQNEIPWELVSKPFVPEWPSSSASKKKKLIVGLGGGLMLGIVTALAIDRLRNRFATTADIEDITQMPLLGEIPAAKNPPEALPLSNGIEAIAAFEQAHPHNARFLESFEALYASLHFLYASPPLRSVVVTSAESGDGKSTIARYLAQAVAATGQRVLLVDANLRQPQLHREFDLPNDKGLSDLLLHPKSPGSCIQPVPQIETLFLLSAGNAHPEAAKRLGGQQMEDLLRDLQQAFDLVIFDTPNLTNYKDGSFLTAHTDGMLLVVGLRKTRVTRVKKLVTQLNVFRLPYLGVVVNRARRSFSLPFSNVPTLVAKPDGETILFEPPARSRRDPLRGARKDLPKGSTHSNRRTPISSEEKHPSPLLEDSQE
ncbi:GumC family protein [Lusitaniella coriacea]|uniref:GumC family protein n=1 Tax=Lusitaniella coriacea TaxID=1983105 RepID=UPI003CEB7A62